MTRLVTGIAGLSYHAPAMSVAESTERIFFTVFQRGDYLGYEAEAAALEPEAVASFAGPVRGPSTAAPARFLPPMEGTAEPRLVEEYLDSPGIGRPAPGREYPVRSYDSDLQLDYIAQPTAGLAVDRFGTSLGGSVAAFFSDMLGNEILGLAVAAQGDIQDIGAEAVYRRMGDRLNWGFQGGRIPYRSGFSQVSDTTISGAPGRVVDIVIDRTAVNRASLFGEYPLSLTRRFEADLGYTRYGFSREIRRAILVGNVVVDQSEFDLSAPDALNLANASLAFVEDYSFFGFTSPVRGGRTRLEVETHIGDLDFTNVLADYRRYRLVRPFTLAFRGMHFGRYGGSAEDPRLSPLFLGQQAFVRGYAVGSFEADECTPVSGPGATCPELDRLVGSRIAVASLE